MAKRGGALDEVGEGAGEYVAMLAGLPTVTASVFKSAIDYSAEHSLRDSLAKELEFSNRTRGTVDAEEGRRSFHEKRVPTFIGR